MMPVEEFAAAVRNDGLVSALINLVGPTIPGFIGAVISLRFFTEAGIKAKVAVVGGGWACATFLTGPAVDSFSLAGTKWENGLAFFIGVFGMSFIAALMQGVKELKVAEIIADWLKRRG